MCGLSEAQRRGPRLAIILPARDEEATVGDVVRALRHHPMLRDLPVTRIVVVDNGSADNTARVAVEAGAEVVPSRELAMVRRVWPACRPPRTATWSC